MVCVWCVSLRVCLMVGVFGFCVVVLVSVSLNSCFPVLSGFVDIRFVLVVWRYVLGCYCLLLVAYFIVWCWVWVVIA